MLSGLGYRKDCLGHKFSRFYLAECRNKVLCASNDHSVFLGEIRMSNEIELTDAKFEEEVLKSEMPVLVDFWAPWCGPCKMLGPVIEELATEYEGKVKVCKLNTDDNPDAAAQYKISAIPTVLFFKDGAQVNEIVGMQSKEEIKKILDELL